MADLAATCQLGGRHGKQTSAVLLETRRSQDEAGWIARYHAVEGLGELGVDGGARLLADLPVRRDASGCRAGALSRLKADERARGVRETSGNRCSAVRVAQSKEAEEFDFEVAGERLGCASRTQGNEDKVVVVKVQHERQQTCQGCEDCDELNSLGAGELVGRDMH